MSGEIWKHSETIEECYEFMLAYAAQGLPSDQGAQSGQRIREVLERAGSAIAALGKNCRDFVKHRRLEPAEKYLSFINLVERDARDSLAAIDLVLAQSSISSQLVDNLNASIHLRALLTDSFLLGDVFRSQLASRPSD
jgi:hypothetical protein